MTFIINPGQMTLAELRDIYRNDTKISLNENAWDIIQASRKVVDTIIEEDFTITDVYFDSDQYLIPDTSKPSLDQLAIHLKENEGFKCELWGYTDNKGSKNYNQTLSEKRAIQVMYYLIGKGISRRRMSYKGNNFSTPIANNRTQEGRARNRRVEIILIE